MRVAILLVLSVALLGCQVQFDTGSGQQKEGRGGTESEQVAVRAAASAVLVQLDAEQWDQAWSAGATALKQTTNPSAFALGVRTSRAMFGEPKSRTLKGYSFTESLEGAPPGQYGIVFYGTDFSRVDDVEEQVVLVQERGQWRLAGYWAKKRKQVKLM